ncbi:helix-turn-helix domain-containing protein [Candidatus Woesearchaeota archaeon]|nr:helix-turn-helix domain-containing protein [Candidatus Woesearchaeota archaeon]
MRPGLLERVRIILLKEGVTLKSLTRTCFDIIARKHSTILLLKIISDANAIAEEYAKEMQQVASYIDAAPLIIAESSHEPLQENVVYSRFGICTLTLETLKASLHHSLPFLQSTHAGLAADIVGERLKHIREKEGISLNEASQKAGVSKKMVQRYEAGQSKVSLGRALRLYHLFGPSIFRHIDIFSRNPEPLPLPQSDIAKKYSSLGFQTSDTKKVPFDVIAKKENDLILTKVGDQIRPHYQDISSLMDAERLVIFTKKKPRGVPAMTKEEFLKVEKSQELIKFVKET